MKRIFSFMTVALCATLGVEAQERDSIAMYEHIQQIEVTAVRAKRNTPIAYSNLSRQEIEERNYGEDIPSLLSTLPSVVVASESGTGIGSTSLRVRGTDATRINVTMNGVPMNDAETHSVYWYDTPDLASGIGSLQLQRGVGTSTAGAGAFGASLNMTSAPLASSFSGRASLSYGSYNTAKQEISLSSGLMGGHWAIDGRLSHISSDGYVDRASSQLGSYMLQAGYYNGNTMIKALSFGGLAKVYLAYSGIYADQLDTNRRYNPEGEIIVDGEVVGYYDDHTDNYLQVNNQLIVNHIFNDKWSINATAHYTYGNGYYRNYKNNEDLWEYGVAPQLVDGVLVESTNLIRKKDMRNHFGGIVASTKYTTKRLSLTMGATASLYDGVHFGTISQLREVPDFAMTEYYRNYTTKWDISCFAKVDWMVAKGLNLFADIQYRHILHRISGENDNYDTTISAMQRLDVDRKYDFVNPKLGIHYTFCKHHSAYASAAVAQKEPTRNNFTDIRKGEYPTAEKMLDIEAGYGYEDKVVAVGINLYYMMYRDQLVQTGELSDTGELLSRNVKSSYRRGVELQAAVRATKWLKVGGNATFSQNHINGYIDYIDGAAFERGRTTIAYSPSITALAYLDFHIKGFGAVWSTRYVSKQYLTNGEYEDLTLPRYTVSDLDLSYTLRTKRVEKVRFGIKIKNILNAKYCASGYGGSWLEGATLADRKSWACYFPQATANVLANVTINF